MWSGLCKGYWRSNLGIPHTKHVLWHGAMSPIPAALFFTFLLHVSDSDQSDPFSVSQMVLHASNESRFLDGEDRQ